MSKDRLPLEQEWAAWLDDPCTKHFREKCRQDMITIQDQWLSGKFASSEADEKRAMGAGQALARVAELDFESFVGSEQKGEVNEPREQQGTAGVAGG